jgi:hypothetical protein
MTRVEALAREMFRKSYLKVIGATFESQRDIYIDCARQVLRCLAKVDRERKRARK